jgi:hypothetical protein
LAVSAILLLEDRLEQQRLNLDLISVLRGCSTFIYIAHYNVEASRMRNRDARLCYPIF